MAPAVPGPFRDVRLLANHWSGPAPPTAYYWYVTFAGDAAVCELAARCQQALAFPYLDPVPPEGLHMTVGRIAAEGDITAARLDDVTAAARLGCRGIAPIGIILRDLGGSRGAVGFAVAPVAPVAQLRDALRTATASVCGAAAGNREVAPHVTVAYANADGVPAAGAIAAVERLNASGVRAAATIGKAELVLLERREHSYAWDVVADVPLAGPA